MSETRQATEALIDLEQLQASAAINATPMTIGSADGRYLVVNEAFAVLTGRSVDELVGLPFAAITVPEDHQTGIVVLAEATASGTPGLTFDKRYIHPDGSIIHARLSTTIVRGPQNQVLYFVTQVTDLTELREAQELSQRNEERVRLVINSASDAYISIDQDRLVRDWNPAAEQMFGWTRDEAVGIDLAELIIPQEQRDAHRRGVDRYVHSREARIVGKTVELQAVCRDGRQIPVDLTLWVATESDGEQSFHAFLRDVTERRAAEAELERMALSDALTGLANRTLLTDRLRQAQQRLRRDPGHVALLMLDLDRFKLVNDTLGHSVGDALLIEVARRLQGCARPSDTVSRLGGDEFILLLDRLSDFAHAEQIAERILEALRAPMVLANLEPMEIRGSIGIAVSSDPDHPADSLYREADLALYRAKDQGRDRYSLFDAGLRRKVVAQVKAERQLRRALAEDRLHLFYQPIIRLADDRVSGSEALVRLQDPDSTELVLPGAFIEAAEESGLIADLDQWVLGRAIEHLTAIGTSDGIGGTVAINVSPRSMVDSSFAVKVAEALSTRQIDPRRLLIEATERTLMDTSGSAVRSLNLLRDLGVRVGLDDFGTGYSSLGYLQQLPLDFLKIDRSFIGSLADSSRARATVEALTVLAHAHGLTVTAEGVETELQLSAVREIGCDYAQGYLTGRPSPA